MMAIPVLAVAGFIVDFLTPQGIDDWVWYFLSLVLTLFVGGAGWLPFALAAGFSVLTLAGYYLSPPGPIPGLALLNSAAGIVVLWVTAAMIFLRLRGESVLRESEARFRSLFDNMMNGFAYCRVHYEGEQAKDFTYLSVNPAFEASTGLKNVIGKRVTEVIPHIRETDPGLFEIFGRVARTGVPEQFETYVEALKMWFAISVYSPAKEHFVTVFYAITERKRVEEELRWKTALLEAQVDCALDGILVVDNQSKQLLKNERFNEVWKIPSHVANDPDDRKCLEFAITQAKNPKEFIEKVTDLYAHPDEQSRDEIELIDGTVLDRYSAPVRDKSGKYYGRIWNFRDVTDQKKAEASMHELHHKLVQASREVGRAEVATSVLHNVGNVLNSVNVATTLVDGLIRKSRAADLDRLVKLLADHAADLGTFLTSDPQGQKVPVFLRELAKRLTSEQALVLNELASLHKNVEHIKEIVSMQQNYAKISGVVENLEIKDLAEETLRMNAESFARAGVRVVRDYSPSALIHTDKHRIIQILVNLLRNAKYACQESGRSDKQVIVRVRNGDTGVSISIIDNGVGIPPENLTRIFNHGFTTRKDGHGFGLHSSALVAKELGGNLSVQSEGVGKGATFALELIRRQPSSTPARTANRPEGPVCNGHRSEWSSGGRSPIAPEKTIPTPV